MRSSEEFVEKQIEGFNRLLDTFVSKIIMEEETNLNRLILQQNVNITRR